MLRCIFCVSSIVHYFYAFDEFERLCEFWFIFLKQKKKAKGEGSRNKENIIDNAPDVKNAEEVPVAVVVEKKKPCYEVKQSDVMGRLVTFLFLKKPTGFFFISNIFYFIYDTLSSCCSLLLCHYIDYVVSFRLSLHL